MWKVKFKHLFVCLFVCHGLFGWSVVVVVGRGCGCRCCGCWLLLVRVPVLVPDNDGDDVVAHWVT